MLGATGKASERERVRMRCTVTNTDENRVETSIYIVEKVLLRSQVRAVVSTVTAGSEPVIERGA